MSKKVSYWADDYVNKKRSLQESLEMIKPGHRVFIGSASGEPQYLVKGLSEAYKKLMDIEIVRLMSLESIPLTMIADKTRDESMNIRSFYLGSVKSEELVKKMRFLTPINLSAVPRLFKKKQLPLNAALIQVCPPDDFGWMSLGVAVDVTMSAALSADLVIAQINPKMPVVFGRCFIHVNDVDVIVEHEEELITIKNPPESETACLIARQIARLIDDGSTIQMSLGAAPQATLSALADKHDIGVHSQFLTTEMMHLVSRGVITNRKKGFNEGKIVASNAIGDRDLYDFLHSNPSVDFYPSDYVNDPRIIANHHKMVSANVILAIDLTGQVAADALPMNFYSGVNGIMDFIRGTAMAEDGKSILMLASTNWDGKKTRIVPKLEDAGVVVPRGDVQYVVTEYGAVNLAGKSYQERAMGLISIAHPEFREELLFEAKKMGLLSHDRTLKEFLHGIYPVKMEKVLNIADEKVIVRPAKPVDIRRIQEHFYNQDERDIASRFFHVRKRFVRDDMESMSLINYKTNMTIIAVTGEFGFGRVVGVGEYYYDEQKELAEVAFSVSKDWQSKGIGRILMREIAEAAKHNDIPGLLAMTSGENRKMIKLFSTLPFKVRSVSEGGDVFLTCLFNEPKS